MILDSKMEQNFDGVWGEGLWKMTRQTYIQKARVRVKEVYL